MSVKKPARFAAPIAELVLLWFSLCPSNPPTPQTPVTLLPLFAQCLWINEKVQSSIQLCEI